VLLFGLSGRRGNNRVFQHTVATPFMLTEKVELNLFLWLKSKHVSFGYNYHDFVNLACLFG